MKFRLRNLHKFYWISSFIFIMFFAINLAMPTSNTIITFIFCLFFTFFMLNSIFQKTSIEGKKITKKSLFGQSSITITAKSKIYIAKRVTNNRTIQATDYKIRIINNKDVFKTWTNFNNAELFLEALTNLEQKIILPEIVKSFRTNNYRIAMNRLLSIDSNGIIYKGKNYLFSDTVDISIDTYNFNMIQDGKLWKIPLLTISLSKIPNLKTFLYIIKMQK